MRRSNSGSTQSPPSRANVLRTDRLTGSDCESFGLGAGDMLVRLNWFVEMRQTMAIWRRAGPSRPAHPRRTVQTRGQICTLHTFDHRGVAGQVLPLSGAV